MKKLSLREVKTEKQVCSLRRDNYNHGNWSISTDGHVVWITKQVMGHDRTDHIQITKGVFDKLVDDYCRPTPVGAWHDDKFYPAK